MNSNWLSLKATLLSQPKPEPSRTHGNAPRPRKRRKAGAHPHSNAAGDESGQEREGAMDVRGSNTGLTDVVALDCEMVGVGRNGSKNALARWGV